MSTTQADEIYYDNYTSMFATAGWKQLMEELEANLVEINKVENVSTSDDLFYRKGQVANLNYLLSLETQVDLVLLQ